MYETHEHEPMPRQHHDLPNQSAVVGQQRQKLAELLGTLLARQWWRSVSTENHEAEPCEPGDSQHSDE